MIDLKNKITKNMSANTIKICFMVSALILPTIGFLLFFVYVNADSVFMAFQRPDYSTGKLVENFSLENFKRIFDTSGSDFKELIEALRNTLIFFFADLLIVFPISIIMSYFFFKKLKGYRFFRFVYYLPAIISSSVLVSLFKYSIGTGGIIDAIRYKAGITPTHVNLLGDSPEAILTILFYTIMFSFGGNIIIVGGSMNGTNAEVLEAGRIDGCGWTRELVSLIIPMMWPTISTMLILRCAAVLSASGPIMVFTKGANGTMTLAFLLYRYVVGSDLGVTQDLYYVSAVGLIMTLMVFPIAMLIKHIVYSDKKDQEDVL